MNKAKRNIEEHFNEIASDYATIYDPDDSRARYPSGPVRMEKTISMLRSMGVKGAILDAGCGTGHMAARLLAENFDVHGVDISSEMVKTARLRCAEDDFGNEKINIEVGDLENLDLPDSSFDAVVCLGVLEYLPEDDTALAELTRVLKPGGVMIVAFRNKLFNLFSANEYQKDASMTGEISHLIDEFQRESASAPDDDQFDKYVRHLKENVAGVPLPSEALLDAEREQSQSLRERPVTLRQTTPGEARSIGAKHGLECRDFVYFHFHPYPPIFERIAPTAFNSLGLIMESLERHPIGSIMASGIICGYVKNEVQV